jgi:hypothetical protein
MIRMVTSVVMLALAMSATVSAGTHAYPPGDPTLAAPNPMGGPVNPFLTNGNAVLQALDAVAQRSGRPLRVTSMSANQTEGLTVDVQEPKNHVNVDRYVVAPDGTLADPVPVQVDPQAWDSHWNTSAPVTAAVVDKQAFDPGTIAFARLAKTAREAIAKSGFSDARVVSWQFRGSKPDSSRWIYLEGARGKPSAEVNAALEIVHFEYN